MSQQHKVPTNLKAPELRNAVNVGLYYLMLGHRPKQKDDSPRTNQRVAVKGKGVEYLDALAASGEWETKADVVADALAWLAEQPPFVLATKIE